LRREVPYIIRAVGEITSCHVVLATLPAHLIALAQSRQSEDPLVDQCRHRMLDLLGRPAVGEATGKAID